MDNILFFIIVIHNFAGKNHKIQKIKGTRINYVSLIFYYYECVKFDPNCPYAISCYDPNSPCFLTPILTPLDSVQNGLKRSVTVKIHILQSLKPLKTLDF